MLLLAQQWLQQSAEAYRLPPKRLSGGAEAGPQRCAWPGNVWELQHLMERVTLLSPESLIEPDTLERLGLPRLESAIGMEAGPATAEAEPLDEAARITQALAHPYSLARQREEGRQ